MAALVQYYLFSFSSRLYINTFPFIFFFSSSWPTKYFLHRYISCGDGWEGEKRGFLKFLVTSEGINTTRDFWGLGWEGFCFKTHLTFIYTAITKSRRWRWLVVEPPRPRPRSRSHSASLSSCESVNPVGGSNLGTNKFPDPSRSCSRPAQLGWCLVLPGLGIVPKFVRASSGWRANCNILIAKNINIIKNQPPNQHRKII